MLKDRLTMVVLAASTITALGTIAGYFGLQEVRPVWIGEFRAERQMLMRQDLWNTRSLVRLTDEALAFLADREAREGTNPSLVERRVKLEQQKEWLLRRVERLENELEMR